MITNLTPLMVIRKCSNLAVVKTPFTLLVCCDKAVITLLPDDTRVDQVVEDLSSFTVGLLLHLLLISLSNTCFELVNPGELSTEGVFFSKLVLLLLQDLGLSAAPF